MSSRREFITLLGGAAPVWAIAPRGQPTPHMLSASSQARLAHRARVTTA